MRKPVTRRPAGRRKARVMAGLVLGLLLAVEGLPGYSAVLAPPVIPAVWDVLADDFQSGTLDLWNQVSEGDLRLVPGGGHFGSTGLDVTVGQSGRYLYQTDVARAEEGYLTFWFNPHGVNLPDPFTWWPPGNSICVANVVGSSWWPPLVALYVRHPTGQGYRGFLSWPTASGNFHDYETGEFDLADGWQKITLGYRVDEWVAVWIDGELVRYNDTTVSHDDPYGEIVEIGKTNPNSDITPSGSVRFDDVAFQVPRIGDLWVDAQNGNDGNDGLTPGTALRTIQRAADWAGPGTTVHIQPGVYRESVQPALNGSAAEPVLYLSEAGPGSAVLRGSEPSSSLTWTPLSGNSIGLPPGVNPGDVYWADLSAWELEDPPRFVVQLDGGGQVQARLPLAREPDWHVDTEWKHHEFWWAADGGSAPAGCDPASDPDRDCDYPSRSMTQLTDRTDDAEPVGIEPGNLSTLGNLTGATLVAIDTLQGHYVYRRTITAHNVGAGRVTVDQVCEHDSGSGNPGLGWGSKYYVEGVPYLLDEPGEWWYDEGNGRLYLWPPSPGDPGTMQIEISRRDNGFSLRNRSYVTVDGLAVELCNDSAVYQGNWTVHRSYGNTVRNTLLRYANWGVYIEQSVSADSPAGNVIDGFTLEDSEIAHMDSLAIRLIDWWEDGANPDLFTRSGVRNTVIRNNEMHHLGFRTDGDNAIGASISFANQLRFEGNYVHHIAHNGVQFSLSVIQSPKTYGFSPAEIKTGEILIKDNVFEKACQLTTDCGALKIWGSWPDNHVFRDFLVTGNVFRDTFGWTYVSEKRGRWAGGSSSEVRGKGGFGLYVDHASGIHAYRNVAYNNAYAGFMLSGYWRDGQIVYVNNVAANSLYGFVLGSSYDTHSSLDTRVVDNIVVNNEAYGISHGDADGVYENLVIDHNLYFNNGWRSWEDGGMWDPGAMIVREVSSYLYLPTLSEIQANTPWEDHGQAGDPAFWDYDPSDHDLVDGSRPDFHLTAASTAAIDRGVGELPASLAALISGFEVDDPHWGPAYDIGRYEAGFLLEVRPVVQAVDPGGVARYTVRLYPADLPHTVTLVAASPSPSLTVALNPTWVSSRTEATLVVTDGHSGPGLQPGLWYTLPIEGSGSGFEHATSAELLVGGARIYLPLVLRDH